MSNASAKKPSDYFSFNDSERSVEMVRPDPPQPWINYLSNGRLHAFVSQAGGGFAWWKSPVVFRMTRYRHYNLPLDSPGFYVYLRDGDGTIWSPSWRPCCRKADRWKAVHRPGMTRFVCERGGVGAVLTFLVSRDEDVLIWDLELSALDGREHRLDVFAYCEFSQMIWQDEVPYGYYTRLQLKTFFDPSSGSINYLYHVCNYPDGYEPPLVYFAGTEKVAAFTASRNSFVGDYGYEADPEALRREFLPGETIDCGEPAGALQNRVVIPADGTLRRLAFFLGAAGKVVSDRDAAEGNRDRAMAKLRGDGELDRQRQAVDDWWTRHLAVMSCDVPDPSARRQINIWNVVNSVVTGRYSRSVNTDAPGVRGVGFRDSCQDMLAIAYRKPRWATERLKYLLSMQFEDGHTVHMSYLEEWYAPVADTVASDDHLWPAMLVYAIVAETGDMGLLDDSVPFLGADGRKAAPPASIWEHLMRAVAFVENHLGPRGLLLTLKSDWNDIIGRFNRHGRGETVFASQQYVYILRRMIEMAEASERAADAERLRDNLERQVRALLDCAWDGSWWRRGFDDDGKPVGGAAARFGKIFLNPQSWAVLGEIGTARQQRAGMDSARTHLLTDIGLTLMTPGFTGWNLEPGKMPVGYGPGCGENGAVFCHANTWAIIAEAILGNGDFAWEYFTRLIPANVIESVGVKAYRAEPYAWVSNIVGPENKEFGWGNVTQITGTAPWMDIAATQYLLGLRPRLGGLTIAPCPPSGWETFTMRRVYDGCRLDIEVQCDERGDCRANELLAGGKPVPLDEDGHAFLPRRMIRGRKNLEVKLKLGSG